MSDDRLGCEIDLEGGEAPLRAYRAEPASGRGRWVRPRRARWNAWEWAVASPGMTIEEPCSCASTRPG